MRHNLSLNPCFEKVARPLTDRGKGSYWTVNDNVDPRTGVHRIRKKKGKGGPKSSPPLEAQDIDYHPSEQQQQQPPPPPPPAFDPGPPFSPHPHPQMAVPVPVPVSVSVPDPGPSRQSAPPPPTFAPSYPSYVPPIHPSCPFSVCAPETIP